MLETATGLRRRAGPAASGKSTVLDPIHRAIWSALLDPTLAIDDFGTIVLASPSVQSLFGWSADELLGQNISSVMPEPHRSLHDSYLAAYRRSGESRLIGQTREFEIVRKDGRHLLCELSIGRVETTGASPSYLVGSFRDVTARRRTQAALAESEARFHAVFAQSDAYLALLSPQGSVIDVNDSALGAMGKTRAAVVGLPFWDPRCWSASSAAAPRVQAAVERAAGGELVRLESRQTRASGAALDLDLSLTPVRDAAGGVSMILADGRDITELRRAQSAETSVLRSLAALGQSAAVLAHEIKSPISAIHTALRAVAAQLGACEREVLDDLVLRMQRLERMLRRTLTFARPIELDCKRVSVERLLEHCASDLRAQSVERGARIEVQADHRWVVQVDEPRIAEVLTNLSTNALEAIEPGGRIRLAARKRGARWVEVTVEDDGPGIPDHVRERLFQPFCTTKESGTGIGLALCKKFVSEHGGRIEADRGSFGGARFRFTLPVA
jgi:PAS domain S-box-containing protein